MRDFAPYWWVHILYCYTIVGWWHPGDNPYVGLPPIALSEQSMSPAPWDSIKHAYSSRYSYNADLNLVNIDTPCTFEVEDTPCTDKQVDCIPLPLCSLFYSLYSYTRWCPSSVHYSHHFINICLFGDTFYGAWLASMPEYGISSDVLDVIAYQAVNSLPD